MSPRVLRVDDEGLHVERGLHGALDVHFDGWRGWSVALEGHDEEPLVVPWPRRLRSRLDGTSLVTVLLGEQEVYRGEVVFGTGEGRVELVDRYGTPVIIDKWGLAQRPFEARRESGAVEVMTEMAERVLEVMRTACDIEGWISFGTLLGAARAGKAIGHDSDIDLCFLSEKTTPAEMARELWQVARALEDAGISVKHKTGSFVTVVYEAPDGGEDGIDIYTCFYVGEFLHETATVRERVPREAVVPLRLIEFEGRQMPAPADPDRLLAVSYGPQWRTPDPSFRHLPSREITDRFDAWFGSVMTHRRDWTSHNGRQALGRTAVSPFARWVVGQLAEDARVLEVGSGSCADLRFYGEQGFRTVGYDFAHFGTHALGGKEVDLPKGARRRFLNLLDERDALATGALAARQGTHRVLTARRLLEALPPRAHHAFWRFAALSLRSGGGRAYLEGVSRSPEECRRWEQETGVPQVWPVDPTTLAEAVRSVGGILVHREGFAAASRASRGGSPAPWRMIVEWTSQEDREPR